MCTRPHCLTDIRIFQIVIKLCVFFPFRGRWVDSFSGLHIWWQRIRKISISKLSSYGENSLCQFHWIFIDTKWQNVKQENGKLYFEAAKKGKTVHMLCVMLLKIIIGSFEMGCQCDQRAKRWPYFAVDTILPKSSNGKTHTISKECLSFIGFVYYLLVARVARTHEYTFSVNFSTKWTEIFGAVCAFFSSYIATCPLILFGRLVPIPNLI